MFLETHMTGLQVREQLLCEFKLVTVERCNRAARLAMRLKNRRLADLCHNRRLELIDFRASAFRPSVWTQGGL